MSESNKTTNEPMVRLCHIVKWVDFDGYGFNLHAEKGKPGQYIGKVDEGSPAEAAGLKEGDRIIEVNGVNISNENHKQVVQRIKSVPDEAKLLVVDSEADHYYKSKNIVIKHTMPGIFYIKTPDYKMNGVPNGGDIKDYGTQELKTRSSSEDESNSEKISSEDGNGEVATPLEWSEPVKSSPENNTDTKEVNFEMRNNNKVAPNATLNLNMTAKELRAQLALRKKYDPKKESLDFRKKYEIVQKL